MSCSEAYMTLNGFRSDGATAVPSSSSFLIKVDPPLFLGELFLGEVLDAEAAAVSSRARSRLSRISCALALIRQAISCVPFPWCCQPQARQSRSISGSLLPKGRACGLTRSMSKMTTRSIPCSRWAVSASGRRKSVKLVEVIHATDVARKNAP